MSSLIPFAELIEQEKATNNKNKELLEKILDQLSVLSSSAKKDDFLVGYYDISDLIKMFKMSSGTIYNRIKTDSFPKQVKLGQRSSGWCKKEVAAWVEINTNKGHQYILDKKWTNIYSERYTEKN